MLEGERADSAREWEQLERKEIGSRLEREARLRAARECVLGWEVPWLMARLREQQLAKECSRVAVREEQQRIEVGRVEGEAAGGAGGA